MEETMLPTQHYVHLLSFPFRGENAAGKFVIACLVIAASYLIPVLPWIVFLGYIYQMMRSIIGGEQAALPVWIDWGRLFRDGSKLFGILFLYTLPINLVFAGSFLAYFVSMFAFAMVAEASPNSAAPLFIGFIPFIFLMVMALGYLLLLATGLILPVAAGNLAARDRFNAGFDLKAMRENFRANAGGYLVAFLLMLGALTIFILITQVIYMTIIFCVLLPFVLVLLTVYVSFVSAALFADAYRVGIAKLAA
jgi:hypothetical protein